MATPRTTRASMLMSTPRTTRASMAHDHPSENYYFFGPQQHALSLMVELMRHRCQGNLPHARQVEYLILIFSGQCLTNNLLGPSTVGLVNDFRHESQGLTSGDSYNWKKKWVSPYTTFLWKQMFLNYRICINQKDHQAGDIHGGSSSFEGNNVYSSYQYSTLRTYSEKCWEIISSHNKRIPGKSLIPTKI